MSDVRKLLAVVGLAVLLWAALTPAAGGLLWAELVPVWLFVAALVCLIVVRAPELCPVRSAPSLSSIALRAPPPIL
jgi:hypothetical protein